MKMFFRKHIVAILLAFSLLLAACGGATPPSGAFAGKVDGSDAFIAVVLHTDGTVTAYVCDGLAVAEWFKGNANGNSLDLTNADGATLNATTAADSFSGTFTPVGGSALNFSVSVVTEPEGLWRLDETVDGVDYVTGWVVLPDGDVRGLTRGGGTTQPPASSDPKSVKGTTWVDPAPQP
ncbi:MAG: hypothetical protein AB1607_03705 [Chloroflexota bacterium]